MSHGLDFERLLRFKGFEDMTRSGIDWLVKPIFVFTVDGGPDENQRYQKIIKVAINHFVQHDLDALFIAANSSGRSTFNRVERKMPPLSRKLNGLILRHDHYGSHLDKKGSIVDPQLEKKNFDFAGKALADVWS